MKMINIGCGDTFHPDWVNLDLVSNHPDVRAVDLTCGLPYPDASADVTYSSHVLEHLRPSEADFFLREQRRVLKPGGTLRIVVPDLEQICRLYLQWLEAAESGKPGAPFKYDFTLLEMFDQTTREFSGGEIGRLYRSGNVEDLDYVLSRTGSEAARNLQGGDAPPQKSLMEKLRSPGGLSKAFRRARSKLGETAVALLVGGSARQAWREGWFRQSGEIHRVMYDRYRLRRLLASFDFQEIRVCGAEESRIPNYAGFHLDARGGNIRKPDSLFMEATRG